MWIAGDWGQSEPWQRSSGVKMTKGEDGVYTGVLALPKGRAFDLKVLKSTVDGTSGGDNVWSAVRYKSVLNSSAAYDFGEFIDNLIPNGSFEGADAVWTPAECIGTFGGKKWLNIGPPLPVSASSGTFVIPPNQDFKLSFYMNTSWTPPRSARVEVKDINTHSVLFSTSPSSQQKEQWEAFSAAFRSDGSPVTAQVVVTTLDTRVPIKFDDMSLVSM